MMRNEILRRSLVLGLLLALPCVAGAQDLVRLEIGEERATSGKSAVTMYGFAGLAGINVLVGVTAPGTSVLTVYGPDGTMIQKREATELVSFGLTLHQDGIYLVSVVRADSTARHTLRLSEQSTLAEAPVAPDAPIVLTGIDLAVARGDLERARALLDLVANADERKALASRALHRAVNTGIPIERRVPMLRMLVDRGADVNAPVKLHLFEGLEDHPLTPLSRATSVEAVRFLIERGAEVDPADDAGLPPLHSAASHGRRATVPLLIQAGANVNRREKLYGRTPLHLAAVPVYDYPDNHAAVARMLIAAGADVRAIDHQGRTPLDLAVTNSRASNSNAAVAAVIRAHASQ